MTEALTVNARLEHTKEKMTLKHLVTSF